MFWARVLAAILLWCWLLVDGLSAFSHGTAPTPQSYFGMHVQFPLVSPTGIVNYGARRIWDDNIPQSNNISYDPTASTWGAVEAVEGVFDWTFFDADISAIAVRGQDIVYTMLGEDANTVSPQGVRGVPMQPNWAFASGTSGVMNLTKLSSWATTIIARLRQNAPNVNLYIETRNEPDGTFASNGGTAAQVVTEQNTVATAVQAWNTAHNDNIKTVLSSVSNATAGSLTFLDDLLNASVGNYPDIMDHHSYASSQVNILTLAYLLDSTNAKFQKYGQFGKEIWSTEGGLGGTAVPDINDRAANTAKYVLVHRAYGRSRIFWFGLDVYTNQYFQSYGLLLTDTAPSTTLSVVGTSYNQAYSWLNKRWIVPGTSLTSVICSIPITGQGSYRALAVWAEDRSTPAYTVPVGMTQYKDIAGVTHTGLGATVSLSYAPILFETGVEP